MRTDNKALNNRIVQQQDEYKKLIETQQKEQVALQKQLPNIQDSHMKQINKLIQNAVEIEKQKVKYVVVCHQYDHVERSVEYHNYDEAVRKFNTIIHVCGLYEIKNGIAALLKSNRYELNDCVRQINDVVNLIR